MTCYVFLHIYCVTNLREEGKGGRKIRGWEGENKKKKKKKEER
jgi:hypothetical protein